MAKRYGCLPSELLDLSVADWSINLRVANQGVENDKRESRA
jgi:hypothetical protein